MNIVNIHIKNVRGIEDTNFSLNVLPNKPSILVAPNGSGKSSFALAFQWLHTNSIKMDEDDAYNDNPENKPEMQIETDEQENNVYVANQTKNEINSRFGVFVINSGLKVSKSGVFNRVVRTKAHIEVPDIELLGKQPNDCNIIDDFERHYQITNAQVGLLPVLNNFFANYAQMAQLDESKLKTGKVALRNVTSFIDALKRYTGTIDNKYELINMRNKEQLMSLPSVAYVTQKMQLFYPTDSEVKNLMRAVKLVDISNRRTSDFHKHMIFCKYKADEQSVRELFQKIKHTWKNIIPVIHDGKFILRLGDVQKISNGERDILILLGMLQKAKMAFVKNDNILIIDEVFDYLDDANLIAAQHYVNQLIADLHKQGKNIYPIIMSHINPSYFRTFAFRDMKVYYLKQVGNITDSQNILKLLRQRERLENQDEQENADMISKYMLHFHIDYSKDLTEIIQMRDPHWGNIPTFKSFCKTQLDCYLRSERYDAIAVCVALREMIEKYVYNNLREDYKSTFLEKHGTEKKLEYASQVGFIYPETFSLLGLIYNDPLHPTNKNQIDLRQTLFSRLENNTIRGMIDEIAKL